MNNKNCDKILDIWLNNAVTNKTKLKHSYPNQLVITHNDKTFYIECMENLILYTVKNNNDMPPIGNFYENSTEDPEVLGKVIFDE